MLVGTLTVIFFAIFFREPPRIVKVLYFLFCLIYFLIGSTKFLFLNIFLFLLKYFKAI